MAATYTLIASNVLGSAQATVTFSSIPATYTDFVVRWSARGTRSAVQDTAYFQLNSDTATNYSDTSLGGNGSAAYSTRSSAGTLTLMGYMSAATATANTFGSGEIYLPSYNVAQNKPASSIGVAETNATAVYMEAEANLWRNTAAVTSIKLLAGTGNFDIGSSFYLYGIKNS